MNQSLPVESVSTISPIIAPSFSMGIPSFLVEPVRCLMDTISTLSNALFLLSSPISIFISADAFLGNLNALARLVTVAFSKFSPLLAPLAITRSILLSNRENSTLGNFELLGERLLDFIDLNSFIFFKSPGTPAIALSDVSF